MFQKSVFEGVFNNSFDLADAQVNKVEFDSLWLKYRSLDIFCLIFIPSLNAVVMIFIQKWSFLRCRLKNSWFPIIDNYPLIWLALKFYLDKTNERTRRCSLGKVILKSLGVIGGWIFEN